MSTSPTYHELLSATLGMRQRLVDAMAECDRLRAYIDVMRPQPAPDEEQSRWVPMVRRRDDMSPRDRLALYRDDSGDVIVSIQTDKGAAAVEFCTIGPGGGRSPKTFNALIDLMIAMEDDNQVTPDRA